MSDVSVRGAGESAAIDAVRSIPPDGAERAAPHVRQTSTSDPSGYLLSHWGHERMAAYRKTLPPSAANL